MARTKQIARKNKGKPPIKKAGISVPQLIEDAHAHLAQQNFKAGITCLRQALNKDPKNEEVMELLGIAQCEGGDLEKGRQLLLQLIPPHNSAPSASTYLYLAQTADSPQEALLMYEAAVKLLEYELAASAASASVIPSSGPQHATVQEAGKEDEEMEDLIKGEELEEMEDNRKTCVTALIAMIEIWMSDLCFEDEAPSQCDALISRALKISPDDIDVRLSLASIRMSESKPEEAKAIVVKAAEQVLAQVERQQEVDDDEAQETMDEDEDEDELDFPPIPTRHLLSRSLLEHDLYTSALRVIDTIRNEDELDVEGCYLEGWAWYCRGEALGAEGDEAEKVKQDSKIHDDELGDELSKELCWVEALASLTECRALHEAADHPDEGILAHAQELIENLGKAGVVLELEEDEGENGVNSAGKVEDVDMA